MQYFLESFEGAKVLNGQQKILHDEMFSIIRLLRIAPKQ